MNLNSDKEKAHLEHTVTQDQNVIPPVILPGKKNKHIKPILGFIGSALIMFLSTLGARYLTENVFNKNKVNPQDAANKVSNYYSSSDWKEFNSADGGFKILFLDYPQRQENKVKVPNSDTSLTLVFYVDDRGDDGAYLVGFSKYPEDTDVSEPRKNLENSLNGTMAANEGNKLISSKFTEQQSYPALDFVIQNDKTKTTTKGRIVLVSKSIYQIVAVQGLDKFDDKAYDKFINSFQLTQ